MQARVLIVDSDISFVVKIKQALQETGRYDVTVFATGQAALEHLGRQRQDVVVVDFGLRDMDGPGLIEKLRAVQPDLAIVAVPSVAYRVPDWLNVNTRIEKPYRARDLDPALQDALAQRAKAPPAQTAALPHDENRDLDAYMKTTGTIHEAEATRGPAARPQEAKPASADDMSLDDLLETLSAAEDKPEPEDAARDAAQDAALDRYVTRTEDLSAQELAARQMDAMRREAENLPPGPLDAMEAPGIEMSLDEIDMETAAEDDTEVSDTEAGDEDGSGEFQLTDDWLATLIEGGAATASDWPDEEDDAITPVKPTPTVVLSPDDLPHGAEEPAPTSAIEHRDEQDLDIYLSMTDSLDNEAVTAEEHEGEDRAEPEWEEIAALLDGMEPGSDADYTPPDEAVTILTDESFDEVMALMAGEAPAGDAPDGEADQARPAEGAGAGAAVEATGAQPREKRGDTTPLPPLEEGEFAEGIPGAGLGAGLGEGDEEESVEYLASFSATIAEVAARTHEGTGDEETSPATPPQGIPAEWELEFLEGREATAGAEAEGEEAEAEAAGPEAEADWMALFDEVAQSVADTETAPITGASETSLDDLLNQIEQQIAQATPEPRPKLKKLPPRQSRDMRPRRRRPRRRVARGEEEATPPLFGWRETPAPAGEQTQAEPRPADTEWQPVTQDEIQPGELPDWLADEVPDHLRQGARAGAIDAEEEATEPDTLAADARDAEAPEPPAPATPPYILPAEPVVVEPTLQSGKAYRSPGITAEEPEPPPLPQRDPDEWRPAFPGEAPAPAADEEAAPDALFVYPGLHGFDETAEPEWRAVTPPAASGKSESETEPEPAPAAAPPPDTEPRLHYAENAQIALSLTQLAVESLAEVLLLTRGRRLMGYTGAVGERDALDLADAVYAHWDPQGGRRQTQVQFVRLESAAKDYILYSISTTDDMVLSMAFPAATPLGQIRRHAREMARALEAEAAEPELEDEPAQEAAPPVAAPAGQDAAGEYDIEAQAATADDADAAPGPAEATPDTPPPAPQDDEEPQPTTSYTCVWTLRNPKIQLDDEQERQLGAWLHEIAAVHRWRVQQVTVRPDYLDVQVEVPAIDSPSRVVEALMDATSNRMMEAYADRLAVRPGQGLWADGYYVVTPSRPLSEREIARFISYQRREQGATGS